MTKREFLTASIGNGLAIANGSAAFAQQASAALRNADRPSGGNRRVPSRMAKTTKLFKSPPGYPNGIAVTPEGLWIAEQKVSGAQAAAYHLPEPESLTECAWLVDWNGKLLKTVTTPSRNTSGMAVGGGHVWMGANSEPYGIFQVDMNSKLISHRQIPLSIDGSGSGCHGVKWHNGKLWIAALRLGGILRVDPKTWVPEVLIRASSEEKPRLHDVCFANEGNIWGVN